MSDLHLEFDGLHLEPADEDVLVLAGDIAVGTDGMVWAERQSKRLGVPVVIIAGNHEFYGGRHTPGHDMPTLFRAYREMAAASEGRVTFLENQSAVVAGVRFVGAVLWTDYCLYGNEHSARKNCQRGMNDHRLIFREPGVPFLPYDAQTEHVRSRGYLHAAIWPHAQEPLVVVTHHAPSAKSIHPRFEAAGIALNPAFASHMDQVVEDSRAALWVHGHMHDNVDYKIGNTRVLCNPRGYYNENPSFNPNLVIDVAA